MPNPTPKNVVLLVATMSSFLTPFMGSAINIALPSIGDHFSLDAVTLGWVATSYLLAAAIHANWKHERADSLVGGARPGETPS